MKAPDNMRSWAAVDLAALERNLRAIRQALPAHLRYISVVKANAYGHGLAPVVTRLMRARADAFAVANLDEAERLREVGSGWPILVLSVLLPAEYEAAIRLDVQPVLSSKKEIRALAAVAQRVGATIGIHLKIDTGMGRLGVWHSAFTSLLEEVAQFPGLSLQGICTHFAAADEDPGYTSLQRNRFLECLKSIPDNLREGLLIHADNSAGMESFPVKGAFNAVRVGLMQFGVRPVPGSLLQDTRIEPVLSFHARVGLVKDIPAGMTVSYGRTWKADRPTRIAVLTAGYADGLSTRLSNRGKVLLMDQTCPIVGRVTMDQTMVDITDLAEPPGIGETATFIGKDRSHVITASDYARDSGQIEWEVFCSLTARTQRIYSSDSVV